VERYNRVYLLLWLLFSAATLALMVTLVLNSLAPMLDFDEALLDEGVAVSFLLLFFISEVIGAILATVTIDRIPWAYDFIVL
jgi:hypothetical protein